MKTNRAINDQLCVHQVAKLPHSLSISPYNLVSRVANADLKKKKETKKINDKLIYFRSTDLRKIDSSLVYSTYPIDR